MFKFSGSQRGKKKKEEDTFSSGTALPRGFGKGLGVGPRVFQVKTRRVLERTDCFPQGNTSPAHSMPRRPGREVLGATKRS